MANTGKQLERLVQEIEEKLLPEGFSVSANERVFNDSGVQIAEFDIEITGYLGSTFVKWLIECRDRPSEGSAPGSWIEQLVGRRNRFNFSKVTAVSTTGFSEGAMEYAEQDGIDLRSVNSLTPESITDWFRLSHVDSIVRLGTLLKPARLIPDSEASEPVLRSLEAVIADADTKKPILVHTGTGNLISISEAWQAIINQNPQLFDGLLPNGETRRAKLRVNYTNPAERYQVLTDEGPVHIVQILFQAEFSVIYKQVPVSQITQYSRIIEQEAIAQSVRFELEAGDKIIDIAFHNLGERDKTFIALRADSSDETQK